MTSPRSLRLETQVFKLEKMSFLMICEGVNTPRSLACYMLAKADEWDQYLDLCFPDPERDSFPDDYLVTEAMRKCPRLRTTIDKTKAATEKWYSAEHQCTETNERLRLYRQGKLSLPDGLEDVLTSAQRFIADVLGPLTGPKLCFAERNFSFGPGATSTINGADVLLSRKMTANFAVTPALYPLLRSVLPLQSAYGTQSITCISLQAWNKVTFVPKDSKTDRAIAIEPHANIYVQLGIGKLLRRQLLLAGLDLERQPDDNRRRAERAHLTGSCTVDLSSASDTIARELVWLLLPVEWASLLDVARCTYSAIEGKERKIEKFSSMGNGFTFELETLIFWALARACGDDDAVAFGDDIIVHRSSAPLLLRTLETLGFSVNARKTFLNGPFFESCGSDFWNGINVRPFYFRGHYEDTTSAVIRICNKIRLYAHRRNLGFGCDVRFLPAWLRCLHSDARAGRTGIPLGKGDAGLIRNFDEFCPSLLRHGHSGYIGKVWQALPRRSKRTDPLGAYITALRYGSPDISRLKENLRGDVGEPTLRSIPCDGWESPGAWCRF